MDYDDIRLAHFDDLKKEWIGLCSTSAKGICALANRYRKRDDCLLRSMHSGSFNFSFRLHWDDGGEDWLIRFPLPGKSMFLDEKVHREAVLMKYIAQHTNIPVPRIIGYGSAGDNPTGLGPFIIMTWVDGKKMSEVLRAGDSSGKDDVLNPDLDEKTVESLYGQMAEILLELWKLDFDCIGSLGEDDITGKVLIDGRPLTLEMNELMRTCGLDDCSPSRTYHSSSDYMMSLLDLQSTHLEQQQNSVYDAVDCREKYTCRHLMKAIALNFISRADNYGPFKLFCDDFCPGNVLVDDSLQVTAVIDWEFCYAAPSQFAGSIPWWLLLQRPETILNKMNTDAFLNAYLPKADIFLRALRRKEETKGMDAIPGRLSVQMQHSIDSRSAWFNLACRKVSSVDLIYWDLLDEFCWGPRFSRAERVYNFTTCVEMHTNREKFVRSKIQQLQEYYIELCEDIKVEYEEELFERRSCGDASNQTGFLNTIKGNLITANFIGAFSIAVTVGLLVRRYRL